jgi:hypothetical protein
MTEQTIKPSVVNKAVRLLYIALALGVFRATMEAVSIAKRSLIGFFIMISILGLTWFLIYKINCGRNWARIVFLVLFVLSIFDPPYSIQLSVQFLPTSFFSGLLIIGQAILRLMALIMLFKKQSNLWFSANPLPNGVGVSR